MEFEKKLKRLEEIVEKMEGNELPLEDSLKLFEEGVSLTRECQKKLTEAEQKVQILLNVDEEGKANTTDFQKDSE